MKKPRFLCILLSILMTAPLFACSGNTDNSETTDTTAPADTTTVEETAETTTARLYPDVPDTNWDGEEFRVMGRDSATTWAYITFEVFAEAENGEVVNDAVFRRNAAIEEKYGVKIAQTLVTNVANELKVLVPAGDTQYDVALVNQNAVSGTAQRGELRDLYSLDHIDYGKPWWNQEMNERISIANRLYFTTSDFTLQDKQRTYIMFFNRDMIEDFKLENPYQLVRDGKWTLDKLYEMADVADADLNADGVYDENDRMGMSMEFYNAAILAFASDNVVCTKDKNDLPVLAMNTEHMVESIDKIMKFVKNPNVVLFVNRFEGKYTGSDGRNHWYMGENMFKEGKMLFVASCLQGFKEYSADCKNEYGVLPNPKYDENQEKHYTMSVQANVITVPAVQKDADFTGFMLEVLSAYSSYTTLPAYYEITCKTKYAYDPESAEMLDIAVDGLVFDLCQIYNWGKLFDILTDLPKTEGNTFSSQYASKEAAAIEEMKKTVEAFQNME